MFHDLSCGKKLFKEVASKSYIKSYLVYNWLRRICCVRCCSIAFVPYLLVYACYDIIIVLQSTPNIYKF